MCQISGLELADFCDPDAPHTKKPCLTSRIKAAETRVMIPILSAIWKAVRGASEHDELVDRILASLTALYEELNSTEYLLPDPAVVRVRESLDTFFESYRDPHVQTTERDVCMWHEVLRRY